MGLDTELDFDKYCKVVRNPKIGRTSNHHGSKAEVRAEKGRLATRSYRLRNLDDDFTEISFGRSQSSSCKSMACVPARVASNEAFRDSIYQCSKEVRKMKKTGDLEGRKKIELAPSRDTSLSFRIFNSSLSDRTCPLVDKRTSSLLSLDEDLNPLSIASKPCTEIDPSNFQELSFRFPSTPAYNLGRNRSSDGSFNISMDLDDGKHSSAGTIERGWREQPKFKCNQIIGPINDGNGLSERNTFLTLQKSSSEKIGMPYSACRAESDNSKDSPRTRFSQFRRLLDPIMKSKSLKSSPVSRTELGDTLTVGLEGIKRNRTLRKSLLNDFSNTAQKTESGTRSVKNNHHSSALSSSPAHLHGFLTLELKHGVPYFEFSLKDPEDVLSAKTWRANNAFNWVYTFHSMKSRTCNSSGWGAREKHKESSMVGQMQVSCFLLSEMRNSGAFDNSMVTEFVLYDIMHARRTLSAQDNSYSSNNSVKPTKGTCGENLVTGGIHCEPNDLVISKLQTGYASGSDDFDTSTQYPWAPADLHPKLEIAAIVIQVPFDKRESLKEKRGNKLGEKEYMNLLDFSVIDQRSDGFPSKIKRANVKVVTPSGSHGLPNKKASGGPSPLLDRWRSGGCCDCGGWDMACPLVVFDNLSDQKKKDHPYTENQRPIELFFQGAKDKMPALTITLTAEGQYSVDFHARLSKLQAFSICVAILHGCEASTTVEQEKNTPSLHCNSLKVLFDDEVRFLIEAVAEKGKRIDVEK